MDGDLSVLLGKLNCKIVAADPKRDSGGGIGRSELSELDEGEALNRAKVWRRHVHVLGNIDIANSPIRLKGAAEQRLKVVSAAGEVTNDKGLDDLALRARAHRRARALQSGPWRTGWGKRWRASDLAYQGRGGGPCGSGGGCKGSDRGAAGSGLCLLKLCGLRPSEGAVADAPHDGVGGAEGGDGAEKAIKPVGALSKAKCCNGSHGISGVIRVRYYYVYGQPFYTPLPLSIFIQN